jgi:parallel beta-helix repeat protein
MRHPQPIVLSVFLALASVAFFLSAPTASLATTTVTLDQPVHFLTPGGEDVLLEPGAYEVEATDTGLKVLRAGEARTDVILLEATVGDHEKVLNEPVAHVKVDAENPDFYHMALLLQDGTGLETIGTKSGIRPRGLKLAFVGKFHKARTFTARPKVLHPGPVAQAQPAVPFKNVFKVPLQQVLGIPKPCDSEKIKKVRAKAGSEWEAEKIDCQLKLEKNWIITKKLIFEGAKANRVTLDCQGATLGDGVNKEMIEVRSRKIGPDKWERPQNVTIKNCKIIGAVRVWGIGRNGEAAAVKESSKREKSKSMNHINRLRNSAPKNIVFDHVTITGLSKNLFYLSPGVTYTTLMNSTMNGKSSKVAIYLDAESAYNTIKDNNIDVKTGKDKYGDNIPGMKSRGWPIIAIDGSSHNKILNNRFSQTNRGGIYLYRNCGEGGTIRHATPSYNSIINNVFYYNKYTGLKPAVFFGSRDYGRLERLGHCDYDDGRPYGSSASEKDYARHNVVMQNQFYKRRVMRPGNMIGMGEATIADYVRTRNRKVNSPNYIDHNQIVTPKTVVKNRRAGCYPTTVSPHANPNFLLHGQSLNLLKESGNKTCVTQYSCTDGKLPRSPTADCRITKVGFSCQVSGKNKGCQKVAACPSGKKLVGAKAACNLEFGTVSSNALKPILPNLIKVLKASDKVSSGSCYVGSNKLRSGQKEMANINGRPSVAVGCKEHDKNGGDCHIKGNLYCR